MTELSTISSAMTRTAKIPDLQALKAPEEGGTKKDYEDYLEKVSSHVTIMWLNGRDIGSVVKSGTLPTITPPKDLTADKEKSKLKL